ncbi:helix-turn-helix domain-containing protein [Kitasatospora nipponensis]|uniref:nSTAND1 domain-containing NTPase n=1 Tax=Kitasatospora nipponensis TaxID=258049 RepID=UPI0031D431F3
MDADQRSTPGGAPTPEDFGAELRRLRTARGLSLSGLSRLVHYSKGYLSKIENGGKPAGPDLARRCDEVLRAEGALLRLAEPPDSPAAAVAATATGDSPDRPHPPDRPGEAAGRALDLPCPYPGLASFGPHDAHWFAGRDEALTALLDRLAERAGRGPLALVAPSGAGKSSLLRAGLVPVLRRSGATAQHADGWRAVVCTPTAHPLAELRRVLEEVAGPHAGADAGAGTGSPVGTGPAGAALVLVVDQFEEVFTLCADEAERRSFVRVICELAAPSGDGPAGRPVLVVLGVRADFSGRCLDHPELVPVFTHGLLALGPMTPAELRETITRPAEAADLLLEAGLVEVLLRDLGVHEDAQQDHPGHPDPTRAPPTAPPSAGRALPSSPHLPAPRTAARDLGGRALTDHPVPADHHSTAGVLPLLSHALLATWQQREGRTLTVAGYLRTGGIQGAIATTAEAVYLGLPEEDRQAARHLLLRLVHVGEESEQARRPVPRDQLVHRLPEPPGPRPPARQQAEDGGDPVAVLDAFVRARLLTADSATVTITHEALLRAWPRLRGWIHADRAGLLIRQQLAEASAEWERERRDPALLYRGTKLAVAYEWLQDHRRRTELTPREAAFLTAGHDQEAERRRPAPRQAGRRRQLLVTLAVLLVLALAAGGVAFRQRSDAFAERHSTLSKALAAESATLAAGRPEASMLLADEAFRTAPTTEARSALLSTQAQPFAGRLAGHTGAVNAVAFSPDGVRLATASSDGTVKVWHVADRQVDRTLTGHGGPVRTVAFSPDGSTIASGSTDGTVRLWDVLDRSPATTLFGSGGAVRSVAFCPDGRTVVSGGADRTVRLWDTAGHTLTATLTGHADEVDAVACSPDGRTVASAGADRTVRLWDTAGHTLTATLTGHSDEVLGLAFSPDGRTVASGAADRTIRLWDTTDHTLTATLTGHSDDVNAVTYTDDGATLVSASGDGTVRLWDVAARRVVATLCGHTDYVQGVAATPDGSLLATAGFDRTAALWDLAGTALTVHPFAEVWQAAFSPDGRTVAAADAAHSIHLWDAARHVMIGTLDGHDSSVFGLSFSPDGKVLASAGADHTVRLWDVAEREQIAVLTGHQGSVFAVAFSPDGRVLASAGEDRTVRLWDVRGRRPMGVLTGHTDFVNTVAFSPNGRTVVSGSDDLTVRLWDVTYQRLTATLNGHTGAVRGVVFGPDGRTLASAGNDGTVRLWDSVDHTLTATLTGHTGSVRGVAFAPDGRSLASAGTDGTVRLWDAARRVPRATLTGHTDAVWSVGFSPDSRTLVSSGSDGTVRVWNPDAAARTAGICRVVGVVDPDRWARVLPEQPYRRGC